MFAKLYETEIGQILVKKDGGEDGEPEVRFYFKPESLGVCSFAVSFKDDDKGWETQENFFNEIDQLKAFEAVKSVLVNIPV